MDEVRWLRILQLIYQALMLIARGLKREIDEIKAEKEKQTSDSLQ